MAGPTEQDKLSAEWGLDEVTLADEGPAKPDTSMSAEWAAMLEAEGSDAEGPDACSSHPANK